MQARSRLFAIVIALSIAGAGPAFGHGELMHVGSSADGSGQLRLTGYDFAHKIVVTPLSVGPTMTLYTTIFPSFYFITADEPATPLYQLPDGTRLTMEIACDGSICIDPGASVRLDRIADATGETASIGDVAADEHVHPEWRLILPNGVTGDYRLPFRITTTAPGYSASQVYVAIITNIAPATATPTATPSQTPTSTAAVPPTATTTPTTADTATATANAADTATATPTATPTTGALECPATPDARPCSAGPRGKLLLKDHTKPEGRSAVWVWKQGTTGDFGQPQVDSEYAWCVYDVTAGTPALIVSANLPAAGLCGGSPCWQPTRHGWQYKDGAGARGGVTMLSLKAPRNGRGTLVLKARGASLALPDLPLEQAPTVRVRLLNSAGQCWESVLPAPARTSDAAQFLDIL